MSPNDVVVIEVGGPLWRRWMIYHKSIRRYWSKGRWRKRRRDGDLFNSMSDVQGEQKFAEINWNPFGDEDE